MKQRQRLWSTQYIFLILLGTMTSTAFYMVHPTLSTYATSLGASLSAAGTVVGLFSIVALVARPFGGLLADRMNKKRLFMISTLLICLAAFGYSVSGNIATLVVFRIIHGIGFAVSGTVNVAIVASVCPKERLGEGIGYYGLAQIVANAIGPSLGLQIGESVSFKVVFIIAGIMVAIAVVMIYFLNYTEPEKAQREKKSGIRFTDIISTKVLPYAAAVGLFSMLNGLVSSYIAMMGEQRGISNVGIYYTVNAVFLLLVRPIAGKLSDKYGLAVIVIPAMLVVMLEAIVLGSAMSLWMIVFAGVLQAVGQGSAQPTLQAAAMKTLPPEKSGVASSTFYLGSDIGQGFGPIIGGYVADYFGYGTMYYSAAGVILAGAVLFSVYLFGRNKREKSPV